jgi:hypothetical protein
MHLIDVNINVTIAPLHRSLPIVTIKAEAAGYKNK